MRVMSRSEAHDFYVARFARVYPLHVFCLCVIVATTLSLSLMHSWRHAESLKVAVDPAAARSFVEELLLIQAWIPSAPRWNIPSWSISAELFAYVLFPFILLLRHHAPRLASFLLLALPLAFYVDVLMGTGSLDIIAGLAPLRCLSGFMIGCKSAAAAAAAAAAASVLAVRCPDPVIIPFFALLVIATWEDRGPLRPLLLRHSLMRSGELSYSVYLNHVGLIAIAFPIFSALNARVQ